MLKQVLRPLAVAGVAAALLAPLAAEARSLDKAFNAHR